MAKTYEYDPLQGKYTTIEDHHDGGLIIKDVQDVNPLLNYAKDMRNSGKNDKVGEFNHYAVISPVIEQEIKQKYGISIYDKNHTKKLISIIESDYPGIKVTNLKHA